MKYILGFIGDFLERRERRRFAEMLSDISDDAVLDDWRRRGKLRVRS